MTEPTDEQIDRAVNVWFDTDAGYVASQQGFRVRMRAALAALSASPAPIDVEQMLRDTVPGGSSCDPQQIADEIRAWFANRAPIEPVQQDTEAPWPGDICLRCYGSGKDPVATPRPVQQDTKGEPTGETCAECLGSGDRGSCTSCDGTGMVWSTPHPVQPEEAISLDVAATIDGKPVAWVASDGRAVAHLKAQVQPEEAVAPSVATFAPPSDNALLKAFSTANSGKQLVGAERTKFLYYARIGITANRARQQDAGGAKG